MSIFDKLKKNVNDTVKNTVSGAVKNLANQKETFTFRALPESLAELQGGKLEVAIDGDLFKAILVFSAIEA